MLRLKDIPPEQMPEVVRIATELHERDQRLAEQDQERQTYVAAAEEIGVPQEYMERAAQELHRKRVVEAHEKGQRGNRTSLILASAGAAGLALVLAGMITTTSTRQPPMMAPQMVTEVVKTMPVAAQPVMTFDNGLPGTLDFNGSTQASVGIEQEAGRGGVAVVKVDRFGTSDGQHRVNLDLPQIPSALAQGSEVAFDMRGSGLKKVRIYFERGANERWRSQELTIPSGWQSFRIPLNNLERQVGNGTRWRGAGRSKPVLPDQVSFKLGHFMNDAGARGEVRFDNVRVE